MTNERPFGQDDVRFADDLVVHRSAGGVVLFEDVLDRHLWVALLRRADGQLYLPKGHVHVGESVGIAAAREVMEELGLDHTPNTGPCLGTTSYDFKLPGDPRLNRKTVDTFLFILSERQILRPEQQTSAVSAEWIRFDEALGQVAHDREMLLTARQVYYARRTHHPVASTGPAVTLSIAIPTWNGSATIARSLESVRESVEQLGITSAAEVIVCLDHCDDQTSAVVAALAAGDAWQDLELRVVVNTGVRGKSTAMNALCLDATGELLCFVDDDVVLDRECLAALIERLRQESGLRCVYAAWERLPYLGANPWRRLCNWILGIKFDIQPYDRPSEMMRASCMVLRRSDYVRLPDGLINDDEYLQTVYWPATREASDAIVRFETVSTLRDYYTRFLRITSGSDQVARQFSARRIDECRGALVRPIDWKRIRRLPPGQLIAFTLYRCVRRLIATAVMIRRRIRPADGWLRVRRT